MNAVMNDLIHSDRVRFEKYRVLRREKILKFHRFIVFWYLWVCPIPLVAIAVLWMGGVGEDGQMALLILAIAHFTFISQFLTTGICPGKVPFLPIHFDGRVVNNIEGEDYLKALLGDFHPDYDKPL